MISMVECQKNIRLKFVRKEIGVIVLERWINLSNFGIRLINK